MWRRSGVSGDFDFFVAIFRSNPLSSPEEGVGGRPRGPHARAAALGCGALGLHLTCPAPLNQKLEFALASPGMVFTAPPKRSSAGLLHRHRHHAVVLSDSRGATTSAARWNGEVDVVFINNRTCDRVRRCCPFVAPEPIVIKIFYALLQAASDRLPQQQEPHLVGFGISSRCAILLESDLQKRFEHHDPHELMNELKAIFETHAAVECYEASKHFFSCMMEEGSSVSEHMLAMTGHAKKLSDLGIVIPNRLGINRVLQSLPPSYKNFVMNYNMQNMNKELPELFGMLKAAEIEIKKEHQVLMVNKTTSFKKQGKSKGKFKKGGKKAATPPMKPKNGPKPDAECYSQGEGTLEA
ncbi:hypothetical protein QYE76_024836 [Lolium multiflorum]|uniref:Uncharacterized protein n=1 Tax=Lolium multiflorum TaxID=4521 RepID=A0AAD8RGV2_LOLMU|nr:hypothetical protein QYE76_024836 [Lolium multiflorum]